MSRYYEMTVIVSDVNPGRQDAVETAANAEWDFNDCAEGGGAITLSGRGSLGGGKPEDHFAQRITKAIWRVNGQFCAVEVCATDLENAPCEIYQFGEGDYDRLQKTAHTAQP